MKITLCLFFLGLISVSMASHFVKHSHPFVMDTSFLKEMKTHKRLSFADFPALLEQSFRDTSRVQEFLQGLLDNLGTERTAQLAILEQSRAQCGEEETFRGDAINEGTDSLSRSQAHLSLCTAERDEASHLRDLANAALTIYSNQLEQLEADRQQQIQIYEGRRARAVEANDAIVETLKYVDELESQVGGIVAPQFVQLTNRLLKITMRTGHAHMVLPIYNALIQAHMNQGYQAETVDEIRGLLNQLRDNAVQGIQGLDDIEAGDARLYQDNHDRLTALLLKLNHQVAASDNYFNSMDACVLQETSISELAQDKIDRNEDLLDTSRQLCQITEDEFNEGENARSRQQRILNALVNAVTALAGQFEAENTSRVEDLTTIRLLQSRYSKKHFG